MNDPSPLIALSRWRAPPGERSDHYLNSLALAGGRVLCLQPDPEVDPPSAEELAAVAGLVLSGGIDVDPRLYGQRRHPERPEMAETMAPLFSAFVQACRQGQQPPAAHPERHRAPQRLTRWHASARIPPSLPPGISQRLIRLRRRQACR